MPAGRTFREPGLREITTGAEIPAGELEWEFVNLQLAQRLRYALPAGALACVVALAPALHTHIRASIWLVPFLVSAALLPLIVVLRRWRYAELAIYLLLSSLIIMLGLSTVISGNTWAAQRPLFMLFPPLAVLLIPLPRAAIVAGTLAALVMVISDIARLGAPLPTLQEQHDLAWHLAALTALSGVLAVLAPGVARRRTAPGRTQTGLLAQYERQQAQLEFIRHIQHELRKYVSAIEAMAPLVRDGMLGGPPGAAPLSERIALADDLGQTVGHLKLLVEQTYTLVRPQALSHQQRRPISLVPLLRQAQRDADAYAKKHELTPSITLELAEDLHIHGDPLSLQLALYTALCNAIDALAAPANDEDKPWTAEIAIRAFHHENTVRVRIEDTGIGFPWHLLERVARRQFNWSAKIGGSGVGLALIDKVATLHGAEFRLGNRVDRRGAWVELAFQRANT